MLSTRILEEELMEEESLMNGVIGIIRDHYFDEDALHEARMSLEKLDNTFGDVEDYRHLKMRENMIMKIVQNGLIMNEVGLLIVCFICYGTLLWFRSYCGMRHLINASAITIH